MVKFDEDVTLDKSARLRMALSRPMSSVSITIATIPLILTVTPPCRSASSKTHKNDFVPQLLYGDEIDRARVGYLTLVAVGAENGTSFDALILVPGIRRWVRYESIVGISGPDALQIVKTFYSFFSHEIPPNTIFSHL